MTRHHLQAWLQELHRRRGPDTADQALDQLGKTGTVALERTDDDHDDEGVRVQLGGVRHPVVDLQWIVKREKGKRLAK